MAEQDRLVRAARPVDKADQPLPHPPVGRVGRRLQVDLDRSIPDLGSLCEEGIDGDLIELIDAAILDRPVGPLDEPLDALDEQDQQRLLPGVGKSAEVGCCRQITGPQVLGPSGQLQPGRDLGRMFPRGICWVCLSSSSRSRSRASSTWARMNSAGVSACACWARLT